MSLEEQFELERKARPPGTPTLEATTAKLKEQGIDSKPIEQAVGRTMRALFCGSTETTDGALLTICEYPSADRAVAGEPLLRQVLGSNPTLQTRVRKQSVLRVVTRGNTPASTLEAVFAAFDAQ